MSLESLRIDAGHVRLPDVERPGFPPRRINKIVEAAVETLYSRLQTMNRGDTITHREITQITGQSYKGPLWKQIIIKAKRRLRNDRGIVLINEHALGYRLATVQEQLTVVPQRRFRESRRRMRLAEKEAGCTPDEEMSDHQRKLKLAMLKTAGENARKVAADARAMAAFSQPTSTR